MSASVLVVDDDRSLVEVLEQVVASQNQTATSISDVDEAIRIVSHEHSYSVLVTDHRLGNFSGVELINLARQHKPDMKCVIMSGFMTDVDPATLPEDVVRLEKPFRMQEFIDTVL